MEPLAINFSTTPTIAECYPEVKQSAARLNFEILGKKVLNVGVFILRSKEEAEAKNQDWTEAVATSDSIIRKEYVPLTMQGESGKEVVYVNLFSLFKHLFLANREKRGRRLVNWLTINSKDDEASKKFKASLIDIVAGKEGDEIAQGELVHAWIQKIVLYHKKRFSTPEVMAIRSELLLSREASPAAMSSIQLIPSGWSPYVPSNFLDKEKYHILTALRLLVSNTATGYTQEEELAVENFMAADREVARWSQEEKRETLDVDDIIKINAMLCKDLKNCGFKPGQLRDHSIECYAGGAKIYQYLPGKCVEQELQAFCRWLKKELVDKRHNPVWIAAMAYQRLVSIHPFCDGNGRTARLVMDWILQKHGLPPCAMEDASVAVFPKIKSELNVTPEEVIAQVKAGIEKSCEMLGFKSPFVADQELV